MSTHYGTYFIPICGAEVALECAAKYQWLRPIAASMYDPSDGGAEIESIRICVNGLDWVAIDEWPDQLVRDMKSEIAKEHRRDAEEFEHEEDAA
jgi:hypothetical protein